MESLNLHVAWERESAERYLYKRRVYNDEDPCPLAEGDDDNDSS